MTTDILRHAQHLVLAFVVACLITAGLLHADAPTHQHAVDTSTGCWFEKVSTDPELICGDPALRPATDTAAALQVHVADATDGEVAALEARGAVADPTDGCECLYVPAQEG
jgi:hypothetical protein